MLAVACAGMLVYAVAGAAPDDGQTLAPASCATAPVAGPPAPCFETAAAADKTGDKGSTETTAKGDKGSTSGGKDPCAGSTPTTSKDGKGDSGSTPTTGKDGKGSDTPPTTAKDSKDSDTPPTTAKDSKDSDTPPTTAKDSKDDSNSTSSTTRDGKSDSGSTQTGKDVTTAAAVKGDGGADKSGSTATTTKGKDSGSTGKDSGCDGSTPTTGKDKPTTSTTDKDGTGSTTDTTRKGGKGSTTTTTDRKDRPTTSTTDRGDSVKPSTPGGGDSASGGDSGGSSDPADNPISPQEAPPEAPASDPGPAADPEAAADPGAIGSGDDFYDMPDEGPVPLDGDEVAIAPLAAPGEAAPVIPSFATKGSGQAWSANRPSRGLGTVQDYDAPPAASSTWVHQTPGQTQSAAVTRQLGGLQTSVNESAFPASVISTPGVFPMNRKDPLAAAALILLIGVARELFKAWRRQANDYWPA
jgi:hypothetical protein